MKMVMVKVMVAMVVVFNGELWWYCFYCCSDGYGSVDDIHVGGEVDVCGNGKGFADTDGDGCNGDGNIVAMMMKMVVMVVWQ